MLQDIRQSTQSTAAKVIVGLIVLSFAGFGIESILLNGGGSSVAEVNGEPVSPEELNQAVYTQQQRLMSMMGDNLDPAMLEDERLRGPALEALIGRKLQTQAADALDLAVSEREITQVVMSMEQFQVDGQFSKELYRSSLASVGYTPLYFKELLADDMLVNQLRTGLTASEFVTPAEMALNARILSEQRDVRYMTLPRENFAATQPPSEEQVQQWYDSHAQEFRSEESVDLEYIELGVEDFFQPVEESVLKEAYELAVGEQQYQSRSRVSHILLSEEGADVHVAEIQAKLAEGAAFADLAAEYSEDIGSAGQGGDLGYTTGETFPAEMEAAIAELQPGEISGAVNSDAGIHLILVTDREAGEPPSLEELRPQLEERLQREEAASELVRVLEMLRDISFNAENLSGPAEELGLTLQTAEGVSRSQADGVFAAPFLLEAAFSDDVLMAGNNSEVIDLGGERHLVLNVRAHHEPELMPLEAVRDSVVEQINSELTDEALEAAANSALAALRTGQSVESVATEQGLDWNVELGASRQTMTLPFEVLSKAFELPRPAEGASNSDLVYTRAGDVVVVQLFGVDAGDVDAMPDAQKLQLQRQTTMEYGALVNTEFQRGLRASADVSTTL